MIRLFIYPHCPFCTKVRDKMDELNLEEGKDFELVNAKRDTPGSEELLKLGGKQKVPFLVDEDVRMYESSDIISYLEKKFS